MVQDAGFNSEENKRLLQTPTALDESMLIGHPRQKVYLAVGATDLRKSVDGLAAIVQLILSLAPSNHACLLSAIGREAG